MHLIPSTHALQALRILSELEILPPDAKVYPELPPVLKRKEFNEVEATLKQLAEIMWNRQPHYPIKYHEDAAGSKIKWGKFNLVSASNKTDMDTQLQQAVHDYIREKFAIKATVLKVLPSVVATISKTWKQNKKSKSLYYKHLFSWIASDEKNPVEMKEILLSKDILKTSIKNTFPSESHSSERIVEAVCSLPPDVVDPKAALELQALQLLRLRSKEDAKNPTLRDKALHQLIQRIESPSEMFENIEQVISSFVLAEKVYSLVKQHRSCLVTLDTKYVDDRMSLSQNYFDHMLDSKPSKQQGLDDQEREQLQTFHQHVTAELAANHNDWVSNFFVDYFSAETTSEKEELFKRLYELWFVQDKLKASDSWLKHIAKKNLNDGTVEITPHEAARLVLHACLIPPKQWSELYFSVYKRFLNSYLTTSNPSDVKEVEVSQKDKQFFRKSFPIAFQNQ